MWKVKRVSATARVSARVSARLYATFQPRSRFLFSFPRTFSVRALYTCARVREREKGRGTSLPPYLSLSRSLSLPTLHIPRASAWPYGKMQLKELSAGKKTLRQEHASRSGESLRS